MFLPCNNNNNHNEPHKSKNLYNAREIDLLDVSAVAAATDAEAVLPESIEPKCGGVNPLVGLSVSVSM